jgi:hypothetical protein
MTSEETSGIFGPAPAISFGVLIDLGGGAEVTGAARPPRSNVRGPCFISGKGRVVAAGGGASSRGSMRLWLPPKRSASCRETSSSSTARSDIRTDDR